MHLRAWVIYLPVAQCIDTTMISDQRGASHVKREILIREKFLRILPQLSFKVILVCLGR